MSIYVVFGSIILITILELLVCHFTLWWLIAVVARFLFCLRLVGATFKIKKLAITEGVALGCMVVFNMVFAKDHVPWLRILCFALFGAICLGIMFFDDLTEVYTSVDEEEE